MNNKNNNAVGGWLFLSLLTLTFIVLKLAGIICWSWAWILSPLWIPTAAAIVIIVIAVGVALAMVGRKKDELEKITASYVGIDEEAAKYGLERQPGESNVDLKKRIAYFKQTRRRENHEHDAK